MRGQYEHLYEVYLNVCKDKSGLGTIEQLKERIKMTDRLHEQLRGMVNLMQACGEIKGVEHEEEFDRLCRDFSPIELFGAFLGDDGEVYSFREVEQ